MSTRLIEYCPPEHDALLQSWLAMPHVVAGWGETAFVDAFETGACNAHRIIVEHGVPVGFVRWHRLSREELDAAGLTDIPSGGFDIDLLIGDPTYLGRGVGLRALCEAESILRAAFAPAFFSLCAEAANDRALRCYRRAGFVSVRSFSEGGRDYVFLRKSAEEIAPDSPG